MGNGINGSKNQKSISLRRHQESRPTILLPSCSSVVSRSFLIFEQNLPQQKVDDKNQDDEDDGPISSSNGTGIDSYPLHKIQNVCLCFHAAPSTCSLVRAKLLSFSSLLFHSRFFRVLLAAGGRRGHHDDHGTMKKNEYCYNRRRFSGGAPTDPISFWPWYYEFCLSEDCGEVGREGGREGESHEEVFTSGFFSMP